MGNALEIVPGILGSSAFKIDYGIKYAYMAGAMYKGIASPQLLIKLGRSGLMGYLGTGGMRLERIEAAIQQIQQELNQGESYGMNLLCNLVKPELEEEMVALFLKYGIQNVEAAAYVQITPSLVCFRLKGLKCLSNGNIEIPHRVLAKLSRPEVAEVFMSPAPSDIVQKLVKDGRLTTEEANLGKHIPMAHDICVESDSGGHTDQRIALTLMPAMLKLRDEMMNRFNYEKRIRIGAAGGIGTPEAAAAAFILGADFILTGSINQCTVEAGTSDVVKDLLQTLNIQDTTYAPAGDMFELGSRVQVVRKGLLFPARANKLYDLYRQHNTLDEIEIKTQSQIQEKYFKRSFQEVWEETKNYYSKEKPDEIEKAEKNLKHKMALIFRWYFIHSARLAMKGSIDQITDYQIHCGSALGAFNQWVKGTHVENWRNRHVDDIAEKLMTGTAKILQDRLYMWTNVEQHDRQEGARC